VCQRSDDACRIIKKMLTAIKLCFISAIEHFKQKRYKTAVKRFSSFISVLFQLADSLSGTFSPVNSHVASLYTILDGEINITLTTSAMTDASTFFQDIFSPC